MQWSGLWPTQRTQSVGPQLSQGPGWGGRASLLRAFQPWAPALRRARRSGADGLIWILLGFWLWYPFLGKQAAFRRATCCRRDRSSRRQPMDGLFPSLLLPLGLSLGPYCS